MDTLYIFLDCTCKNINFKITNNVMLSHLQFFTVNVNELQLTMNSFTAAFFLLKLQKSFYSIQLS